MKTIIKLLVAALLINAAAQVGLAFFKYYQFEDAIHEAVLFSPQATDADIVKSISDIAEEREVPLEAGDILVTRTQNEVRVHTSYDEDIAVVPGVYTKTWTFEPSTSVRQIAGVGGARKPR